MNTQETDTLKFLKSIDSLFQPRAEQKSLQWRMTIETLLPVRFGANAECVQQVIVTLLSNALRFTSRGYVSLQVGYSGENGQLYFKVEDSGQGMSTEQTDKIFDNFVPIDIADECASGSLRLNLACAKRLAQNMGGNVFLMWSDIGIGSCFEFCFRPATVDRLLSVIELRSPTFANPATKPSFAHRSLRE